ncbi:MAG: methylated-DNA--[protein]-cysteine S-methyltransferase [Thermoplasmata archaeon]|nr:methylated-DNA--[protein]-cysteine S-methyltransferase [Thermoplasmata archaeon]
MSGPCIHSFISIIGSLSVTEDGEGRITGLYLPCQNLPAMDDRETDALADAAAQVNEYLSGRRRDFDVELSYEGTDFFRAVMEAMVCIPYGETRTYAQVAEAAGSPKAFRAVGSACAANPIPIIVPCHRVVPASGGIGNYSGGTSIKRRLLEIERQ